MNIKWYRINYDPKFGYVPFYAIRLYNNILYRYLAITMNNAGQETRNFTKD